MHLVTLTMDNGTCLTFRLVDSRVYLFFHTKTIEGEPRGATQVDKQGVLEGKQLPIPS